MECRKCGRYVPVGKLEHEECRNVLTPKQQYDVFAEPFTSEERTLAFWYFEKYFWEQYKARAAANQWSYSFSLDSWYWAKRSIALTKARNMLTGVTISIHMEFKQEANGLSN